MGSIRILTTSFGALVVAAAMLIATLLLFSTPTEAQGNADPNAFACEADAGTLSWNDVDQLKYWVYRSTSGGTYQWIGRTFGSTTFTDSEPVPGATYQVHFPGSPRVECTIIAEPASGPTGPFTCEVNGGVVSWPDFDKPKYWVYKSTDGVNYPWLGRTLGETTFTDPDPVVGATYLVNFFGIDKTPCTVVSQPSGWPPPFDCEADAGALSWTDAGQSKYWVYKSTDDVNFQWLGRTLGDTTFTDPAPVAGAVYQVHYQGIPRVECSTLAEPGAAPVAALPGVIEAESYFEAVDSDPGNQGDAAVFADDVDVWAIPNGAGLAVGRIEDGESTSYRVSTATAGSYAFVVSHASADAGGTITVTVDGADVVRDVALGSTGGWWTFRDVELGTIDLPAGDHVVTVSWGPGQSNFDKLLVGSADTCVVSGVAVETALSQADCGLLAALGPRGDVTGDPCDWDAVVCSADGTTVIELELKFNTLRSLPPEFGTLTELTKLTFDQNGLASLPPEIGNLTKLTTLDLGKNRITSFPAEVASLTSLRTLKMGANSLASPSQSFATLATIPNLQTLDISGGELTSLPAEIGDFASLVILDISDNQLTSLPPAIGDLTNLVTLNASKNQLGSLPGQIGGLAELVTLDASNNQIAALPAGIGGLTRLTTLDLDNNNLVSLPPEIGNLSRLRTFEAGQSSLAALPPEFGNLTSLTRLWITDATFTELPPEIGNLSSLVTLHLWRGNLVELPPEIGNLTNLHTLSVVSNALTELPPEIGNLSNLTVLAVASNELTEVPPEIGNLTKLTQLNFVQNDLTTLPPTMANLVELDSVTLWRNALRGNIDVLAAGLADGRLNVQLLVGSLERNDCMTTTVPALQAHLDASIPGWDRCLRP